MGSNLEQIHFCHIPKCGGKSFKKGLEAAYGDDVLMWYVNPLRHRPWGIIDLRLWRTKRFFFPKRYLLDAPVVYGHFCFDDIVSPPNSVVKRGAFFRDPVEWFGSYYFYHRHKYPGEFRKDPMAVIRKMDLSNGFKKYLGSVAIESLDFVGITERYQTSLDLYEKIFSKKIPYLFDNKTKNNPAEEARGGNYRDYFGTEGVLDKIEEAMQKNQEIYQAAVTRYDNLVKIYGL